MIAHIFADLCDGCETCVTACPTHVLDAGPQGGPPMIARLDQCQTCFLCELYCPQDAIFVGPDQTRPEAIDPAAIRASGLLGQMRRDHIWDAEPGDLRPLSEYWKLGPYLMGGSQIAAERYAARHRPADSGGDPSGS